MHRTAHPDFGPAATRNVSSPDDRTLVSRCLAGDSGARRELFERTSNQVYRIMLRMTGNEHDASDMSQDAFVKALSCLSQFDGRSNIATWLCRIAMNEALQAQRRRRTFQQKIKQLVAVDACEQAGTGDVARRLDMKSALARLRPLDRAMLVLRYQEGLDYRAIGEVTGLPGGTVASRLNRARDQLRRLLQPAYGPDEAGARAVHPNMGAPAPPIEARMGFSDAL